MFDDEDLLMTVGLTVIVVVALVYFLLKL